MKNKQDFISFISLLSSKHGMFMINNVEELSIAFIGYSFALNEEERKAFDLFMGDFTVYINSDFKSKEKFSWQKLIRLYSGSDKHSLELFETLFTKYLQSHNVNA
ncbi:MAG: hypothetical protein A2W11_01835 [Ignavibacteria bacterium RBG_16_35_7]|nr:MAG: hypothetical protein A2W11_01835 [Ignavibacteria bacterium RBG_16_35_7]